MPHKSILVGKTGRESFKLPIDLVTQTSAILARKGAGKTYTGQVEAEGLLNANQQLVVLDPLDAWWGLRSSADGKKGGFEIVIFGGEHGDLPLEKGMASAIANLIAESPDLSCILSLRHLRKHDQYEFTTAFAETLFHSKGKSKYATAVHLFIDESDRFAPQRIWRGAERMLGAMEDLVRRGRQAGIGVTMISQRPQSLNKDVLTQVELLIVGQITGPHDKKAIQAWIELNADEPKKRDFMSSLATLKVGQMWYWSPSWLRCMALVNVQRKQTFDSSATPKVGTKPKAPRKSAKIDLKSIRKELQNTIKTAEDHDPKALRKRIVELEKELKKPTKAPRETTSRPTIVRQAPMPSPRELQAAVDEAVRKAVDELHSFWGQKVDQAVSSVTNRLNRLLHLKPTIKTPRVKMPRPTEPQRAHIRHVHTTTAPSPRKEPSEPSNLGKCERSILTILGQKARPCSKSLIALQSGYSIKSSGFSNAMSRLRTSMMIVGNAKGPYEITEGGMEILGDYDPLPTGDELVDYWTAKLGKCPREILKAVSEVYPHGLPRSEIAERTGYSQQSSGFANALSRLRSLELVEGRDKITLSEEVFL